MPNRPGSFRSTNVLPRTDVTLYGIVHGILEAERAREAVERRVGLRHHYRCTQRIAPLQPDAPFGQLPFRPIQCLDLSAAGFSYLTDEPPREIDLIIALGDDRPICLRAEVVRTEHVVRDGKSLHRVACHFTRRAVDGSGG